MVAYDLPAAERNLAGTSMAIGLLNAQIAAVATSFGAPVADLHQAFQGGVGLWEGELAGAPWFNAHPTKKGHRVIANVFADLIRSHDGRMTCPAQ